MCYLVCWHLHRDSRWINASACSPVLRPKHRNNSRLARHRRFNVHDSQLVISEQSSASDSESLAVHVQILRNQGPPNTNHHRPPTSSEEMSAAGDELATIPGIQEYLQRHPIFAAHTVEKLSGGLGNFTYRIHLLRAFAGHQTLVLKYAPPYIASSSGTFPIDQKRQVFINCGRFLCSANNIEISSSKPMRSVSRVSYPQSMSLHSSLFHPSIYSMRKGMS